MEGQLELETIIEIQKTLKIPINMKSWELKKTVKTIQSQIRTLNQGDYFGHEEILLNLENRQTRVKSISQTKLFYMNKFDFMEEFVP